MPDSWRNRFCDKHNYIIPDLKSVECGNDFHWDRAMSAFRPSLRRLTVLVESQHTQLPATTSISASDYASRTLYVKPQDGLHNMAQVFAVARELEKRFGPVTDMKTTVVSCAALLSVRSI